MQTQVVLEKLGKCSDLRHLKQAQALVTTLGHSQTQLCAFKLVRSAALISLAGLSHARLLFDRLASPNVYLFAAMITAYAAHSHHSAAFDLYRHMLRLGASRPNQFVYPQVLKSAAEVLEPRAAGSLHAQVVRTGFGRHPVVQTGLVGFYAKALADVVCARKVFDEMSEISVVTWTALISGYIRLGDVGNAMALFEGMPDRDVPSWNAVIVGCVQNGLFSQAILLFKRFVEIFLREKGSSHIRPNGITVASALSACGHRGMLQLGRWIHSYIYRNGLGLDSFISNALVDMYGKCGNLKEARLVFDMTSWKCLTSWNSMINCYALHGQNKNAISVFKEMTACKDDNIRPNEITFIGLLSACTHRGLVEEGIAYFDLMTKGYEIKPQIEHYGCLIDLLGRAGRFDEALEVLKGMEFEPDEVVWGSLLNGCKIHRRTDVAEFALQRLMEIDPQDRGYASALANIYGELGKWDEVRKLRKTSRENNAYKTPGCSWIEVNERVCQFYSADTSHPRAEEIYGILECLVGFISFKPSVELKSLALTSLANGKYILS